MTKMLEAPIVFSHPESIGPATVVAVDDTGLVDICLADGQRFTRCNVLQSAMQAPLFASGDAVLVWRSPGCVPVLLGRIGAAACTPPVPQTLTLEATREVVIKNERAKIKLTADGGIEVVCENLSARAQRLLRLLAPLIKLN